MADEIGAGGENGSRSMEKRTAARGRRRPQHEEVGDRRPAECGLAEAGCQTGGVGAKIVERRLSRMGAPHSRWNDRTKLGLGFSKVDRLGPPNPDVDRLGPPLTD